VKTYFAALAIALTLAGASAAPALAGPIADGTVSSAHLFSPTVALSPTAGTYTVSTGGTFQVAATGGFAGAAGGIGTLNGRISFSTTVGGVVTEALRDLFVFSDGAGGTFNFSADSVTTRTFANTPGLSTSGSLYLLGSTRDATLAADATPSSLTISFNSTGGSPFSSSATLAVPPEPFDIPEPATLALLGAGLLGTGVARRRAG
jgi:hypothetical protein